MELELTDLKALVETLAEHIFLYDMRSPTDCPGTVLRCFELHPFAVERGFKEVEAS